MTPHERGAARAAEIAYPILRRTTAVAIASLLVLGAIAAAAIVARAAPVPGDGPQLAGVVTPDKTLWSFWVYGLDGRTEFVRTDDVLRVDELHVVTYAPIADTVDGRLLLEATWERAEEVTQQSVVNGTVSTRTLTMWNQTLVRAFEVEASAVRIEDTALELPSHRDERLTLRYGPHTLLVVTHDTSALYVKLPRQQLQERYLDHAYALLLALGVAAVAIRGSRWIYTRAGGYVPDVPMPVWIGLGLVGGVAIVMLWLNSREGIVLRGIWPPLVLFGVVVALFSLKVWRQDSDSWLFFRLAPSAESSQPEIRVWTRAVPRAQPSDEEDPDRALGEFLWIDTSWRGFAHRLIGGRTYLRVPDGREWFYNVQNHAHYRRVYLLAKDVASWARPKFVWEWKGWRPSVRYEKVAVTDLPVSTYAESETAMQVITDITELKAVAETYRRLQFENSRLRSALQSASVDKARGMLFEQLRAAFAARHGIPLEHVEVKFEDFQQHVQVRMRKVSGVDPASSAPATPTTHAAGTNADRQDERGSAPANARANGG